MIPAYLRVLGSVLILLFSVMLAERSVERAESSPKPPSFAVPEKVENMDVLASRVHEKLKKAHIKEVAVLPFSLEKIGGHRALSSHLSDSFIATLANTAGDIHLLDRAYMLQAAQKQRWMSIDILDPLVFRSVAFACGADALVHGTFKLEGKVAELSLKVVTTSAEKVIADVKARILIPEVPDDPREVSAQDSITGDYLPFVAGVTAPAC